MPIASDHGNVDPLFVGEPIRLPFRQAHRCGHPADIVGARVENFGQPLRIDHAPVSPDECVHPVGEMGDI